jgi:hypothetical protein
MKTFLRTMAVMVVLGAGAQAHSITQTVNFQYRTVAKEQDTHDTASPRPHKRSAVNSRSPAHLGEILSLRSRRHCRRRFGSPGRRRRSHFRSRSFGFKRGRAPREPRRPELLAVLGGSASTDRDRRRSPRASHGSAGDRWRRRSRVAVDRTGLQGSQRVGRRREHFGLDQ